MAGSLKKSLFFLFPILCIAAVYATHWELTGFCTDVGMYLVGARELFTGAKLYVDVSDINPPLIFYINMAVVWLARLLAAQPYSFLIFLLLAGQLAFAGLIVRLRIIKSPLWYYAAIAYLAAPLEALLTVQFGQREHIFSLFLIPYLCCRWKFVKKESFFLLLLVASTAMVACLKPGFLAIILVCELYFWFRFRVPARRIWLAIIIPPFIYLCHFFFLSPEVNYAFWRQLVPLILARYELSMGLTPLEMFHHWGDLIPTYGAAIASYLSLGWKFRRTDFEILILVGICALTAMVGALLQAKGWEYHLIPVHFCLLFGFPICVAALREQVKDKFIFGASTCILAALVLYYSISMVYGFRGFAENHIGRLAAKNILAKFVRPGDHVLIFSPSPFFSYPLFYEQDLHPGSKYLFLFPLAFFNNVPERREMIATRYPGSADFFPGEREFVEGLRVDIQEKRPELLVFPRFDEKIYKFRGWWLPPNFDTFRYAVSTGIIDGSVAGYTQVYGDLILRIYRREKDGSQ
ncbi:MAG: hypothetical protein ACXWQJ_16610 [Bdellovibrionota bacterium]